MLTDRRITVLLNANVTELMMEAGSSRLDALRVRTLSGRTFTVRSRAVVLAAGGIENPRLLLSSTATRATGIGNEHDLVGRCFMEHIHTRAGHMWLRDHTEPPAFYRRSAVDGNEIRGLIAPTDAARRARVCSPAPYRSNPPFTTPTARPSSAGRRASHSGRHRLSEAAPPPAGARGQAARQRPTASGTRRCGRTRPEASGAQCPRLPRSWAPIRPNCWRLRARRADAQPRQPRHAERRRDALGMPMARLDWRLSDGDTASVDRLAGQARRRPAPDGAGPRGGPGR